MNEKKYRWVLYFISTVIIVTICIQVYWNYINYQNGKQQLVAEVQQTLDKTVDDYYADLAKKTTFGIFLDESVQQDAWKDGGAIDDILKNFDDINETEKEFKSLEKLDSLKIDGVTILRGFATDSVFKSSKKNIDSSKNNLSNFLNTTAKDGKNVKVDFSDFEMLTSKVVVSIKNDTLDVRKVNKLLIERFKKNKLDIDHRLSYFHNKPDSLINKRMEELKQMITKSKYDEYALSVESKSTFLPKGSSLNLVFGNETLMLLKRGLWGILISTLLVLAVIGCLYYLLNIIKQQKQLAEMKNDLISNITHEFKTPIATIGVALESINDFDGINSKEKTKKYVDMSSQQLKKLNVMVEKILETATLDSKNLELNFESIDIKELLQNQFEKYESQYPYKSFSFQSNIDFLEMKLDIFHFENAINNILDNAVKYGGDIIEISLSESKRQLILEIKDNGGNLTKAQSQKIFEKFYRVPKGNTHEVKGFGIGLYYTKTIIEKHFGEIKVDVSNHTANFIIKLPL